MRWEEVDRSRPEDRTWVDEALRRVEADAARSADTHLHVFPMPPAWQVDLYLKDESVHPTGSLKHRLARSLFLYALTSGWIHEGTPVIEASSGSTAISEAYFARLIGVPFIAVMPRSTSSEKVALIEFYGGHCHLVDEPAAIYDQAGRLAGERGGHYIDQFTYAERATDWRGNNNIAESIFEQLREERYPVPAWIVVGAGTGGTSATIGRYVRYKRHNTRVAVVRKGPPSTRTGPMRTGRQRAWVPASRASGGHGSSLRSYPLSSTGWSRSPMLPASLRCDG